jgi:hypothetical protein
VKVPGAVSDGVGLAEAVGLIVVEGESVAVDVAVLVPVLVALGVAVGESV